MKCFYITPDSLIKGFPIIKEPIPYVPVGESGILYESVLFDISNFKLNDISIVNRASFIPQTYKLMIDEIGYYSNDTHMKTILGRPVPSIIYELEKQEDETGSCIILLDIPLHRSVDIAGTDSIILKDDFLDKKVLDELQWQPMGSSPQTWIIKEATKTFNGKAYPTWLFLMKQNTILDVKNSQFIYWNGKNIHITYVN